MPACFIPLGEPAHDAERQALRFIVEGLPSNFTVYGNAWLVERSGVVYELDAVVAAPHAVFVVETKAYRGAIETDFDWYIPHAVKSPIGLNRKTAQILHTMLRSDSFEAGQVWVQGLVFLSATTNVGVKGPASRDRIHTRKTILVALGADVEVTHTGDLLTRFETSTPLRFTSLSRRAVSQLSRNGILTVGELIGLTEPQVRAIHSIGTKTANEVLALQVELRGGGIQPAVRRTPPIRRSTRLSLTALSPSTSSRSARPSAPTGFPRSVPSQASRERSSCSFMASGPPAWFRSWRPFTASRNTRPRRAPRIRSIGSGSSRPDPSRKRSGPRSSGWWVSSANPSLNPKPRSL